MNPKPPKPPKTPPPKRVKLSLEEIRKRRDPNYGGDGIIVNFLAGLTLFLGLSTAGIAALLPFFIIGTLIPPIGVAVVAITLGFVIHKVIACCIFFILFGRFKP